MKQGKALRCDQCEHSSKSTIETWTDEALEQLEKQVPYACLGSTTRRWVADYYDNSSNTIVEVTTSGQKSNSHYSSNLEEKSEWCKLNSIRLIVVDNINKLEDIVQTLGKPKESN